MRVLLLVISIVASAVSAIHFGSSSSALAPDRASTPDTFIDRLQHTASEELPGLRCLAVASSRVAEAADNAETYVASIPDPLDTLRRAALAAQQYRFEEASSLAQWVHHTHADRLDPQSRTRAELIAGFSALQSGDAAVAREWLSRQSTADHSLAGFQLLWTAEACLCRRLSVRPRRRGGREPPAHSRHRRLRSGFRRCACEASDSRRHRRRCPSTAGSAR